MINPMKTWADEIYEKGFKAGYNARKVEAKEEDAHTLHDIYRRGYIQGGLDALSEIEEISLDDIEKELAEDC